jgi:pimeloyl-ACP methyl ester carboxylesterase
MSLCSCGLQENAMTREPLPVVLVPGLMCSPRLYTEQISALWRLGPVQVADHRRDARMDDIALRILAAAPPRFALAGLSMGGYIALAVQRQAPERVERLALLDTGARSDTPEQTERRLRLIALAQAGRFMEIADLLFPLFVARGRHADARLREIVRAMARDTGPEVFERQQRAIIARADMRGALPAISCPTLVLVGADDELTPPVLSQEMAAAIPGARLVVVPECGHLSTLEQPEAVNAALVEWLCHGRA